MSWLRTQTNVVVMATVAPNGVTVAANVATVDGVVPAAIDAAAIADVADLVEAGRAAVAVVMRLSVC